MPYIKKDERREKLRNGEYALNAGELNYQIFYYVKHTETPQYDVIKKFVDQFLGDKPNYQRYNDITGCIMRCWKEIERRLNKDVTDMLVTLLINYDDEIAQYEDKKIIENGDVE